MSDNGAQQCPLENDIESRLGIVCSFVCTCNEVPNQGRGGINLKQSCVDIGIARLNETCDTGLRVQVPYYVPVNQAETPMPLMIKDAEGRETVEPIRNFGHAINRIVSMKRRNLPISETEKNRIEGYNRGELRIPDAVALRDPNGSPTQDNLLGVIEVKFPPDDWRPDQRQAYERIAGERDNLKLLTPERCGCDGPRQTQYETDAQPAMEVYRDRLEENGIDWGGLAGGAATVGAAVAIAVLSRGRQGKESQALGKAGIRQIMQSLGRAPAW
ncbi:hypothetical protein ACUY1T_20435 [Billgrantia sp. Q4P2]|uniref:hypothetical protein n=1 Tax=Billgrantia sp. Q4P2 TaxID=3463857 RepID=UPI0040579985